MNFDMFCKISLFPVSLATLVALERFLSSVRPHVLSQIIRSWANVVALVAFERFFFCMLPYYMIFQLRSFNARIIA